MISIDSRTRGKLVWIATMCAPILAVQGVRSLLDSGPAHAAAATAADLPLPAIPVQAMSDRQRDALRWLMDRGAKPPTRSPMDRPDPAVLATQDPGAAPVALPAPPTDDRPRNVRVSSIIGDGQSALAAINNRVRRVGEQLAPDWTIVRIDSRARAVVLRHADGREVRFEPETPAQ